MKKYFLLSVLAASLFFTGRVSAQCDSTVKICNRHITAPFVSDGQTYLAFLNGTDEAEFQATFFQGTTYRIAAATGTSEGNIIFSVYSYDPKTGEKALIFTNSQHNNASYWDFKVNTTVEVVIDASINPASGKDSGCAVVLIGFEQ